MFVDLNVEPHHHSPRHSISHSTTQSLTEESSKHYRVTLETCDLWDIWSEWWGNMTWPKKWQFLTILTIFNNLNNSWKFWQILTFLIIFTIFYNLNNFNLVFQFCHFDDWKDNPGDLWDTDYNSDNWEPEFMTIFVTWQLIVTLDSIRNSWDVCICHEAKSLSFHCDQENQTKGWFLFKIGFMCALKGRNYKTQWQKRVEKKSAFSLIFLVAVKAQTFCLVTNTNIPRIANAVQCHN
jgi:hypothetical protein